MARTQRTDPAHTAGRRAKALQFMQAAADTAGSETTDAYITLLVNAGIAASDVICAKQLGYYSTSENHSDAVKELGKVDGNAARVLQTLLAVKSKSAYTPHASTSTDRVKAERAANKLIDYMQGL